MKKMLLTATVIVLKDFNEILEVTFFRLYFVL